MLILGLLWFFYYLLHSILATNAIKDIFVKKLFWSTPNYRLFYNGFAAISLVIVLYFQRTIETNNLFEKNIYHWIAASLFGVAALLVLWFGFKPYNTKEFLGLNKSVEDGEKQVLSTGGLNSIVRHPLYFGVFLGLIFWVLTVPSEGTLIAAALSLLYLYVGSYFEEKRLIIEFGSAYLEYRHKVKRIIPFLL